MPKRQGRELFTGGREGSGLWPDRGLFVRRLSVNGRAASRPRSSRSLTSPRAPAEVALDRIPELLGESERLRAILWARLALRINRSAPTEDRLLVTADADSRLGVSKDSRREPGVAS